MVRKYVRKPGVVEAVKLDIPNNDKEVLAFIGAFDENGSAVVDYEKQTMAIPTLAGVMAVRNGDYIIKSIDEVYPCEASAFERTFSLAE